MHPYHQRRHSEARLAAITEYLDGRHGFTVLELGALDGYFSTQLAEQFGAHATAVDDSRHLTDTPGVTAIHSRLTATEIRKLGQFDVTLCLSVLHHLTAWKSTLNALLDSAPIVFIETAHPNETLPKAAAHKHSAAITAAVEKAGGVDIAHTPGYDPKHSRPLFVIDTTQPATT